MVGTGKEIPDRDAKDIGLPARRYLSNESTFVLLLDDLESSRRGIARDVYQRYRDAMNCILGDASNRASVHFLVNMLEAYYFADPDTINTILGTNLKDYNGDVETIDHPKQMLKQHCPEFDAIKDGEKILRSLDVPHILSNPDTCASLRTLFGWCMKAIEQAPGDEYQLVSGKYYEITKEQIEMLQT